MSKLFPDTSPEAEQVLLSLLREAPAWRKLELLDQMNRTVRMLALAGLRKRHPRASPTELRRRFAELVLGRDLAAKALGQPSEEA